MDTRAMSKENVTGIKNSGTTDESPAENAEADLDLAELIDQHESIDWSDVPGISAAKSPATIGTNTTARSVFI